MRLKSIGNFDVEIKEKTESQKKRQREQIKMWGKKHPERTKMKNAKRRELGFDPFNGRFIGSVAHHIDFECVIYIPRELHISIHHCVWTGQGMAEINDKVFEWLTT
jgi:hypothetical protein